MINKDGRFIYDEVNYHDKTHLEFTSSDAIKGTQPPINVTIGVKYEIINSVQVDLFSNDWDFTFIDDSGKEDWISNSSNIFKTIKVH